MSSGVTIVGAGVTKFGKRTDVSYRDLMAEAIVEAINSTNGEIEPKDIDGLYVAASQPELLVDQAHVGNLAAQVAGITPNIVSRVEMACASGSAAMRNAWAANKSGLADTILLVGLEKMTHNARVASRGLCLVPDVENEAIHGITAYSGFALAAKMHMKEYGTTREQMSSVAVKNHYNAARNPKAQFHEMGEITLEKAINSKMVSEPFNLFDCSPLTDGASAVIITRSDLAKNYTDQPIQILGSGQSTEPSIGVSNMKSITEWHALKRAAKSAYEMANKTPSDIQVAETHDCFTIAEIIEYEDLGFTPKGQGGKFIEEGESHLDGSLPINTSGGLKAKGHPIGATGLAQITEIVNQLRGNAGKRQVADVNVGLTHNLSGFATHHVIHILGN
ncbi:MAG: thiolase domain-containing protein [Candidatus Heimdallarchaeota archaeon]|nr:thiolase domain-containing protein [Candidatus Heimdallarchaeota archaeon]